MGYVIKDFECPKCGITERVVDWGTSQIVCCGVTAHSLISAPKVIGADSFNPHFDITQGVFFSTPEHKRAWLKAKDKEQVEGSLSPRISENGRVICSSDQAVRLKKGKKFKKFKPIKQTEIPGLNHRRTSPRFSTPSDLT